MQKILKQVGISSNYSKNRLKIFGKEKIDVKNKRWHTYSMITKITYMNSFILAIITGTKAKIKNFETVFTSSQ